VVGLANTTFFGPPLPFSWRFVQGAPPICLRPEWRAHGWREDLEVVLRGIGEPAVVVLAPEEARLNIDRLYTAQLECGVSHR
jgi:hypothetical protein